MTKTRIKQLGANKAEVHLKDGTILFVSYETVVAAKLPNFDYIRTSTNHSQTTQKHITQWLEGVKAEEKSQDFLDNLLPLVG
tara:strand:+ start:441 stop:686 length:246 start_codon:yes stop_codon:yes gene_type:complete